MKTSQAAAIRRGIKAARSLTPDNRHPALPPLGLSREAFVVYLGREVLRTVRREQLVRPVIDVAAAYGRRAKFAAATHPNYWMQRDDDDAEAYFKSQSRADDHEGGESK